MPTLVPGGPARASSTHSETHEAAVLADDAGRDPSRWRFVGPPRPPAVERLARHGERRLRALLVDAGCRVVPSADVARRRPEGLTLRDVDVPGDLPL